MTDSYFYRGRCYFYGKGVEQDEQEAVSWFMKAAKQGHAKPQEWLKSLKSTFLRPGVKAQEIVNFLKNI